MNRSFVAGVVAGMTFSAAVVAGTWAVWPDEDADPRSGAASPPARPSEPATTAPTATPDDSSSPPAEVPSLVPTATTTTADVLPAGDPVTCPAPTRRVADAAELTAALAGAVPGDSIELADGRYEGKFVVTAAGSAEEPIFLCGGPGAVLDGGGIDEGYGLHLDGVAFWRLVGFTVTNSQKGVVADGVSRSVIQGLTVEGIGDEAIHLRTHSTYNAVLTNTIRDTGLRRDTFGEGVYVGSAQSNWPVYTDGEPDRSDYNLVQGNDISSTGSESVDVKEGTTGGAIVANTFDGAGMTGGDSWVDVKGNDWMIAGNVGRNPPAEGFQTHRILDGWGTGNVFTANVSGHEGSGQDFYIHDPDITDNEVRCDNTTAGGEPFTSNVTCAS